MPFAPVNGIDLYYEVHGSGPPLVFAHGSGGNHLSWWRQVPFFSTRYTCITFDHRSFGSSRDDEAIGRGAFADDLRGLLDHLGIDSVSIVAHSMGGRTGVGFALRNPGRVTGLVLSGSNGGSVNDESRALWAERQERNKSLRGKGVVLGLSTAFAADNPEHTFLYRQILRMNPRHEPDFLAVPTDYRGSTHERLAESGVPILYIVGDEDALAPPRTIEIAASQVPQARLLRVPGAGHAVYYEQPERFNREVLAFLDDVHPPAAGADDGASP